MVRQFLILNRIDLKKLLEKATGCFTSGKNKAFDCPYLDHFKEIS